MEVEFLLALQFLTKIPITIDRMEGDKVMARSMAYFSLVGLLIGGAAAGLHYVLCLGFSPAVANLGAIIFVILLTGNLHGDGLMDTADGIFSGRPKERMLEIMKDSRVGSHGVMAGVLVVLLRCLLLGELDQTSQMMALVLAPTLGRWAQVYGAARYTYARSDGGTGSFTAYVGWRELAVNSIIAVGVGCLLLKMSGVILLGVSLIGVILFYGFIKGKLGGITGDTLGAANEWIEILTLMMMVLLPLFKF
ncbi:cobalamin 5''-phosphate synthase/cobalamin synthase [Desulfosporosinus orientis DSM 765]|uniref:Adenosylcobinamide-GDP ribazoletransferase n=1 Tax=Desulfosporosinus orientis (strain ATCC 19365 / DSM 765 / NCIMB 8382 / VKM B-1628 / Singapore I) TaxID=768706 RepID=G7WGH1_DESOD|nr:adenosylcobinamide-GDP ribazoletransferase [Desulfosporosinus orientis]AET68048.1 cobalamin 5''-phosphate synthase/cobalamin synthase [Desulfosporosinus orientis DSM 765]